MAFFDQYKAINRNAISKDDKLTTKQDLWASLGRQETKIDAINVVKVLVDFKVEQSRTDNAERMLGSLVAPLASLNRKLKQIGQKEIAENKLHELVRNRSTVFKRTLPDTFKSLLREYLRDAEAKRIIVNTNTAAFLKANDLISQADVAAASPEAARSAQVLAIDLENLMNRLDHDSQAVARCPNTYSCSLSVALEQALRDYPRIRERQRAAGAEAFGQVSELYRASFERFTRRMARSPQGLGSGHGVNLREPQTTINSKQKLQHLKRFVNDNRPSDLAAFWAMNTGGPHFPHDFLRSNAAAENKPDWNRQVRQNCWDQFVATARTLFPPANFESLYWDTADLNRDVRMSQRLAPDVKWGDADSSQSPYIKNFKELNNDIAAGYRQTSVKSESWDVTADFDMLVMLSCRQTLQARPLRFRFANYDSLQDLPTQSLVRWLREQSSANGAETLNNLSSFNDIDAFWCFPTRICVQSREVEYVLHSPAPVTFSGTGGPSDTFWRSRHFTVRFSWSQDTNFTTNTFVDEKPWIVRYDPPEFQIVQIENWNPKKIWRR